MIYQKFIAVVLGCLLLATMFLGSPTQAAPSITYDQANQACTASAEFEEHACLTLGGSTAICLLRWVKTYRLCMAAHGYDG